MGLPLYELRFRDAHGALRHPLRVRGWAQVMQGVDMATDRGGECRIRAVVEPRLRLPG